MKEPKHSSEMRTYWRDRQRIHRINKKMEAAKLGGSTASTVNTHNLNEASDQEEALQYD